MEVALIVIFFLFLIFIIKYNQSDAARLNWKRIRTLDQFAELVNTKPDFAFFAFELDNIIERNGWTKLIGYEICSDGKRKLVFKDANTVIVVDLDYNTHQMLEHF